MKIFFVLDFLSSCSVQLLALNCFDYIISPFVMLIYLCFTSFFSSEGFAVYTLLSIVHSRVENSLWIALFWIAVGPSRRVVGLTGFSSQARASS